MIILKTVLLTSLISFTMSAQKIIEKNIEYKNRFVEVELAFATHIEVKTWDKPSLYFKADLTTEDGKYLDLYALEIEESDTNIKIYSNTTPLFEASWNERKDQFSNNIDYHCYNLEYEFNYVLYVPKDAQFKVSSINGNLSSEVIEGDFTAELINGNIDIKTYAGALNLSTINGEIDLKVVNSNITAETIHGNIYADEKLVFSSEDRVMGKKIAINTDHATSQLHLNTINGNMYLRR